MDEKKDAVNATFKANGSDVESTDRFGEVGPGDGKLVRQLKNRHVAMIRCVTGHILLFNP